MFLDNKYTKWYYQIIEKSRLSFNDGYHEIHHIIPRSLGGSNDPTNLVRLSAREHFICHLLLTRMVEDNLRYKTSKAFTMMSNISGPGQERYIVNSYLYEILKKNTMVPEDVRIKMSVSQKNRFKNKPGTFSGKKHSEVTKKRMSISASRPRSAAWKQSASINRKGRAAPNLGIPHSEETKEKMRRANSGEKNGFYGKHHTVEQREKKRQEKLSAPKIQCPHCTKMVDPMNFARWHGDKCKQQ
jgi:hypothetical protein